MAIVIGGVVFTAWELALMGAAAITALFLASPPGQQVTREAARDISDALDDLAKPREATKTRSDPISIPKTIEECPKKKNCPPCVPPVGTTMFEIHKVPPQSPHYPCPGDHVHFFCNSKIRIIAGVS